MICRLGVSCDDEELPGQLQRPLDVREVLREAVLADVLAAHVDLQPHEGVEDRHGLGHQLDELARRRRAGEREHLDQLQEVARIFAADQPLQGQRHPLDVDVLPVVAHRAAHVHDHGGGALGRVPRAVNDDVFLGQLHRQAAAGPQHGVDERLRDVHVGQRVAELVGLGL